MNILPKKSWHVRTKANIERVRKDEEKAADEEKERQRKIALAEQEARTSILRDRARKRGHDEIVASPSSSDTPAIAKDPESEPPSNKLVKHSKEISLDQRGHINFFKDIEEGLVREGKNKEHEAEKAAEKEKWEKQIGLLTYLGQSSIESQNDTPWYLHDKVKVNKDEEEKPTKPNVYEVREAERQDRDGKLKNSLDPLRDMRKHLEKHHKHKHGGQKHKERHHKHKKSSKEKKEKAAGSSKASSSSISSSSSSSQANSKPSKTVEQMRAERLRREASEKQKIAAVMARARGEIPAVNKDDLMSDADKDRSRGYNSKYNPNFVKPLSRNRH